MICNSLHFPVISLQRLTKVSNLLVVPCHAHIQYKKVFELIIIHWSFKQTLTIRDPLLQHKICIMPGLDGVENLGQHQDFCSLMFQGCNENTKFSNAFGLIGI